ncbi:hypothetical protein [Anaerovorax odorimutans]|uniref:hypothetical protein n=1 Tax=Anaerovorax odorimutans TaxID=109327 RepID=UPI0004126279|nr:hypothetical protein [Anaerovorax odorimutans]
MGRIYLPYYSFLEADFKKYIDEYTDRGFTMIPVIPNITKDWNDFTIRRNFDKIVKIADKNGISIGNLGWIQSFVSSGVDVFGDYGLNLINSADFLVAKQLGLKEAVISHDTDTSLNEIKNIDFHGVKAELAIDGKIPVMTSAHCLLGDQGLCNKGNRENSKNYTAEDLICQKNTYYLIDKMNKKFRIISNYKKCNSVIISYRMNKNRYMPKELGLNTINYLRSSGK